jgi:twitching motility protein PilT
VTQREVGRDTASFAEALRRSMREDPDVIVVGEMRDLDTMSAAMTLAETGHLTFATLHTSNAAQTISRIVSAYPAAQQAQARVQLASTLRYVICQRLIRWDDGKGRSLAAEVLGVTPAVRAMIRDEKSHQIRTVIQTNYESGMRTLTQSLNQLVQAGRISPATASRICESEGETPDAAMVAGPGNRR